MTTLRRRASRIAATFALTMGSVLMAQAQTYPSKPIRIVVPASPASNPDALTRTLANELGVRMRQSFIVENVPGAGGNIASVNVAKAAPDGYTLLMQLSSFVVNPSLYRNVPYDPVKQFRPVIMAAWAVTLLVVSGSAQGINSVKDLIAVSKAHPGQLNYTSPGVGTPQHLRMEIFKRMTGADLTHIPFKTPAEMVRAIVVGDVTAMFNSARDVLPQARAGKLKLLAFLGQQRWPQTPDVPTMAEAGFPDFRADIWLGFFAPAGTPDEVIRELNSQFAAVLNDPAIKENLSRQGMLPTTSTPEQFAETVRNDVAYWAKVIKENGISVD